MVGIGIFGTSGFLGGAALGTAGAVASMGVYHRLVRGFFDIIGGFLFVEKTLSKVLLSLSRVCTCLGFALYRVYVWSFMFQFHHLYIGKNTDPGSDHVWKYRSGSDPFWEHEWNPNSNINIWKIFYGLQNDHIIFLDFFTEHIYCRIFLLIYEKYFTDFRMIILFFLIFLQNRYIVGSFCYEWQCFNPCVKQ